MLVEFFRFVSACEVPINHGQILFLLTINFIIDQIRLGMASRIGGLPINFRSAERQEPILFIIYKMLVFTKDTNYYSIVDSSNVGVRFQLWGL